MGKCWNLFHVGFSKDPDVYSDFRTAWMDSISEFNQFGAANFAQRLQIDDNTAAQMYGFKAVIGSKLKHQHIHPKWFTHHGFHDSLLSSNQAGVCDEAWSMIEKHLHRYRFAESGWGVGWFVGF